MPADEHQQMLQERTAHSRLNREAGKKGTFIRATLTGLSSEWPKHAGMTEPKDAVLKSITRSIIDACGVFGWLDSRRSVPGSSSTARYLTSSCVKQLLALRVHIRRICISVAGDRQRGCRDQNGRRLPMLL